MGKTTVALGLMGALKKRGYRVQGFKVGPDYLDTSYHRLATGRPSVNLDTYLMGRRGVVESFQRAVEGADIAVVEGVMGLHDSISGTSSRASTAEVARILDIPVVLVIDVGAMARSAGATALGFKAMDPGVPVRGVILNRVGGLRHARWCAEAIKQTSRLPTLGALPTVATATLPERHLGLVPVQEKPATDLRPMVTLVSENVDIDALVAVAQKAHPLRLTAISGNSNRGTRAALGLALDGAFNFYYQDNLWMLQEAGFRLVNLSPLSDQNLPNIQALYIGGGFPEVAAHQLSENSAMLQAIRRAGEEGMPIYAECGGLMYLCKGLKDAEGRRHRMAGLFDGEVAMTRRLTLGYVRGSVVSANQLFPKDAVVRGHEFHFSATRAPGDARFAYVLKEGRGISEGKDGWVQYSALASYMHMHFASRPSVASNLLRAAVRYGRR